MAILVTGSAGFIGYHLTKRLLNENKHTIGIDNLNTYYDKNLKLARNDNLLKEASKSSAEFHFFENDIQDNEALDEIFNEYDIDCVVNLAAQAGVRYSIENPSSYVQSNLVGFGKILEKCRHRKVKHLVYASSSSVYGGNTKLPFNENDSVDHPVSLYAASKKANELMAHTYSHLYNIPTTGLRFFTVYGPWGRPDMALFLFTKAMINNEPINVFNHGKMLRDFTYIDDIIESLYRVILKPPSSDSNFDKDNPNSSGSWAPYKLFNIGNSNPVPLMEFISSIEKSLGIKASKNFLEMQPGDVESTSADTKALEEWTGFKPSTSIQEGIDNFIMWYKEFYKI